MSLASFLQELRYLQARIKGSLLDLEHRTGFRVKRGRGQRRNRRNR